MAEAKYKIVFRGEIGEGWDPGTVKKNLAALLKQDASGIARLFSGESRVIKSGLSREAAARYKEKIENTGAVCQVLVDEEVGTDLKFKCPNCQKVLKVKAELGGKMVKCPSCGQGLVVPAAGAAPAPPPIPDTPSGPEPVNQAEANQPPTPPHGPDESLSSADDGMSGRGPADPEEDSDYMDGGLAEKEPATAGARKKPDVATLSPMAGQVIQSKEITKRLRLKELLRLLAELTEFDETADQLRDKARSRAFIFLGLTIAAFFGTFFAVVIPFLPLVTLLAGVVFFILMIVNFVKKRRWSQVDLANDFRLALYPFLLTIAEDIYPKGRLAVRLDLSGPTDKKIVKKEQIPPGRFKKVTETIYADPWCRLEAPLAEGSRLILDIENTYVAHERHWRNARGKHKSKTKWKKQVTIKTGLAPNASVLEFDPQALEALGNKEKIKTSAREKGLTALLSRSFKFKEVNKMPEATVSEEELLAMYFQLGMTLRAAGTGSQAL